MRLFDKTCYFPSLRKRKAVSFPEICKLSVEGFVRVEFESSHIGAGGVVRVESDTFVLTKQNWNRKRSPNVGSIFDYSGNFVRSNFG